MAAAPTMAEEEKAGRGEEDRRKGSERSTLGSTGGTVDAREVEKRAK